MAGSKEMQVASNNLTPMSIIQTAVSSGADISHLERLMDLQERWEGREAKKAFDCALAKFKSTQIKINKDNHVKFKTQKGMTDYKHATLGNIIDIITPKLSENGLSLTWRTGTKDGLIEVTAVLSHELGHSESTSLAATSDQTGGKNAIQAAGSTISYLQRYTALAITGLTTEELDDDGKGAGEIADNRPEQKHTRQARTTEDTTYLDSLIQFVDGFCDKSLDELQQLEDTKLAESYKRLPENQKQRLKSHVDDIKNLLMEKEGIV